jgi:hypothetical protein
VVLPRERSGADADLPLVAAEQDNDLQEHKVAKRLEVGGLLRLFDDRRRLGGRSAQQTTADEGWSQIRSSYVEPRTYIDV